MKNKTFKRLLKSQIAVDNFFKSIGNLKPLNKQPKHIKNIVQKMGGLKSQLKRYEKSYKLLYLNLAENDLFTDIDPKILYNPKKWGQIKTPKIKWSVWNIEELQTDGKKLLQDYEDIETQIIIQKENLKIKKDELKEFIKNYKIILKQYDYLQKIAQIKTKLEELQKQYKISIKGDLENGNKNNNNSKQ